MKELQTIQSAEDEAGRAEKFYTRLRARLAAWLAEHHVSDTIRGYLLLLPDLFALLIRLLRDGRIEGSLKKQLILVSAYVISPIDLIPDVMLPLGLVDDTVAVAFILSRVVKIMGQAGEDILREHWDGEGDIVPQIQKISQTADAVLSSGIMKRLRKLFH